MRTTQLASAFVDKKIGLLMKNNPSLIFGFCTLKLAHELMTHLLFVQKS
jgi:hypothetical protein